VAGPGSAEEIRWGILGAGRIAATFARDLQLLPDARLVAVGARSEASAEDFAARFATDPTAAHAAVRPDGPAVPRSYGSYPDLVADPDVDVVYVATVASAHHDAVALALRAGKPVLCEKPFTIDAVQAAALIGLARERNLFLMEAMWTRFLPHFRRIAELLRSGFLGEIRAVHADHGQLIPPDPGHRMHDPARGGGALLDLGVYLVQLASMVLGPPERITAAATLTATGVDAQTSILLQYSTGAHAVLTCGMDALGPNRAAIVGTNARIEIDGIWYQPTGFTLTRASGGGPPERFEEPRIGHGLRHQATEVHRCLRAGLTESPVMPLEETLSTMRTLDEVRHQIGFTLP
jgi:predicted dehydrogenase